MNLNVKLKRQYYITYAMVIATDLLFFFHLILYYFSKIVYLKGSSDAHFPQVDTIL